MRAEKEGYVFPVLCTAVFHNLPRLIVQSRPLIKRATRWCTSDIGVTPSMFPDIVLENFTTLSLDDTKVELRPGGRSTPVTWENRLE